MKIILTLLLLASLSSPLYSQCPESIADVLERQIRVWQDLEKDYNRFIKKQARLRKKLDKHINQDDLQQIQVMRSTYYDTVDETILRINKKALKIDNDVNSVISRVNKFHHDRLRSLIKSEDLLEPLLLPEGKLEEMAEFLTKRYSLQIDPIYLKISLAYAKLAYKEYNLFQKHLGKEEMSKKEIRACIKEQRFGWKNRSDRYNLYGYSKTLITRSGG